MTTHFRRTTRTLLYALALVSAGVVAESSRPTAADVREAYM